MSISLRPDLAVLSAEDLAAMANRGLVKRAQKEVEAGELKVTWQETPDGTVVANWSDSVTCTIPGGKILADSKCTCGALEMCRHILRSVLAWQIWKKSTPELVAVKDATSEPAEEAGHSLAKIWDPGSISDALIEQQVPKQVRASAEVAWRAGVLVELLRSAKPSARFHLPGHTVRFPVPNDLRYAHCSCPDPAPCVHSVLAVKAFRRIPVEQTSAVVSEGTESAQVPGDLLMEIESCVRELLEMGIGSVSSAWRDRLRRVAKDCEKGGLIWPGQILDELSEDFDRYTHRDAVFNSALSVERSGELFLRVDAIRHGKAPVPQAFIRGMKMDRDCELGSARMIGLGASVEEGRKSTAVTVFLQDTDSGHVLTLVKEFNEDPATVPVRKVFHQLAAATAVKDASLGLLAKGQLITQGGKRTAAGKLYLGRARSVVNPQNFSWEQLKAPLLAEDFSELRGRLKLLPLASFRPRRAAADFHVCPLGEIVRAGFNPTNNMVYAIVSDKEGQQATLFHPWSERGQTGAEALLAALTSTTLKPLFFAGHVRLSGPDLTVRLAAMVFAGAGNSRKCIIPHLDSGKEHSVAVAHSPLSGERRNTRYLASAEVAEEVLMQGLRRLGKPWPGWARAIRETEELGYHRMGTVLANMQNKTEADRVDSTVTLFKMLALARDLV